MSYYINRELSWLKFNKRVLEESRSPTVPDFEKLKFISIFTSNLDEFFMVRTGCLHDRSHLLVDVPDNKTGMSSCEQLDAIYRASRLLYQLRDLYFQDVKQRLRESGIDHRTTKELSEAQEHFVKQYFKHEIQHKLSVFIIDAKHPFPHLENKKSYVCVFLKSENKNCFGIISIPAIVRRLLFLSLREEQNAENHVSYLLVEDIIMRYASEIFSSYTVNARCVIRITRNADIELEDNFSDDDVDYREHIKKALKKRELLAPIRAELYFGVHGRGSERKIIKFLCENLHLTEPQCFVCECPADLSYVFPLEEKILTDFGNQFQLFHQGLVPQLRSDYTPAIPVWEAAKKKDILLSYPYTSMKPYLRFLEEAANDPRTVSIKITLYRLSANSEVINLLCRAAENRIEVTAVVELKARFDESNNIGWSQRLEEAGCNVIYGLDGLKIHSKITLVTRVAPAEPEEEKYEYTVHLATGNYNEKTAKIYTDIGIITAHEGLCEDAVSFFKNLVLGLDYAKYNHLLVAPKTLKSKIIELIRIQTAKGEDGYIRLKMNGFTDKDIIDEIIAASEAGVKIDLIIRGICCLQSAPEGPARNIRVHSIVGRFLEHSRIFIFGKDQERTLYIGSADLMTRNTTRRIEIIAPVYDADIARELFEMTEYMLRDTVKRSVLCSNGEYEHVITSAPPFDSQMYFYKNMYEYGKTIPI